MSERPVIIIRRKKRGGEGHHGGAWKIAFADFMTALMALFLVLWMLANSGEAQKAAVAEYFRTPLVVALMGGDREGASENVIPGGGPDPTFAEGERFRIDPQLASRLVDEQERARLRQLERRIREALSINPILKELKDQILIDLTPEGLRIQLVDTEQRPMFEIGSARVAPYMRTLLRTLAPMLNELPNRIQISGHTDSLPYAGGEAGYSNWELSADRANASRRELIAGGLALEKLLRTSGMSDRIPFEGVAPNDAANRRIAVIVLDSRFADSILDQREYGPLPGTGDRQATDGAARVGTGPEAAKP
ncbi:Flagellar motor protein [Azotobacter vinelandii CA]|uniref:Flagellar motor protein n=2 Tax=Azotobacter vinelandii TaxID=354 RepID=C1DHM5_AZOVD|nr:flagellar motor protein MotB [Azotobacter vinelandii]ACO78620.1 Flagellar motor protein [Azotobacter vinelandii DJ]AGK13733.1 Flagellar motor protein [Azotobacter vinelandii CA]AGK18309.1 Flagellar motor protein [Azotobacter vinelandii CA6]WKN24300.1 flagellar motor protein MotB [Azotobacter vinelandii]SFX90215.1 chemotaxis protein MotB [Azotobacter vinelandii]